MPARFAIRFRKAKNRQDKFLHCEIKRIGIFHIINTDSGFPFLVATDEPSTHQTANSNETQTAISNTQ